MKKQKPVSAADDEWEVARVSLYVESFVYANGRQQAYVRVYIEAQLNFEPVELTQSEKDSVRLIDYLNPDNEIPFSDSDSDRYRGWSAQRDYRGYDAYPDLGPRPKATRQGGDYLEFYVDAKGDAVGAPLGLAFIVTGRNGWKYRTDGYAFNKEGIQMPYNNNFDTGNDKLIRAKRPRPYNPAEFLLDPPGDPPTWAIFDQLHTLSLRPVDTPAPSIKHMSCDPAGMIHWINDLPSTRNPCFTGYASPGEEVVHWDGRVPVGDQPLPRLDQVYPFQGVIMLCGRGDIPRSEGNEAPRGPVNIQVIDTYGNEHSCRLEFVAGQRAQLRIM